MAERDRVKLEYCPHCKNSSLFWDQNTQLWRCLKCRRVYTTSEISEYWHNKQFGHSTPSQATTKKHSYRISFDAPLWLVNILESRRFWSLLICFAVSWWCWTGIQYSGNSIGQAIGIALTILLFYVIKLLLRKYLNNYNTLARRRDISPFFYKIRKSPLLRLLVILVVIALLVTTIWSIYSFISNLIQDASLIYLLNMVVLIAAQIWFLNWLCKTLRHSRQVSRKPKFAVVFWPLIAITIIGAFVGIEPLASYKDTALDYARTQGSKIAELIEKNAMEATLPESKDTASPVAKVKSAVVMIEVKDGIGSGMIIDKSGYVLTCYHVVENAQYTTVAFTGGGQYQGKVVAKNEEADIAIIKITASDIDVPVVNLGSSGNLEIGEEVMVVGYSLGLEGGATVSKGIVSALRYDKDLCYVQTDAAINPGNSGGPLIDLSGNVIGIATSKVVHEAVEGMGFAIAIDSVKPFIAEVKEKEQAQRRAEEMQGGIESMEREVLTLVNAERSSRNIASLAWDNELHRIASEHSQEMATRGELFHSSKDKPYAENCWGGSGYWDASTIVDSWLGSDKHRTWLLCPNLKHIGIGIAISDNGMYASWTFWRSETAYSDWWYVDGTSPPNWWY
jgi:S1-C subfamily serine protease